ncbi:hypothetical protein [Bifidobacterium canis]|uniref:hypothetical protein n=1 Tax=Bifidobacterium canis TaxID=2610880 RepID=UPI0031B595F6
MQLDVWVGDRMSAWRIAIVFTSEENLAEETVLSAVSELGEYGATATSDMGCASHSVTLTVDAVNAIDAVDIADGIIRQAFQGHDLTVVGVEAVRSDASIEVAGLFQYPEVVGYAEIARMAGVSRQRARMFPEIKDFPKPVIRLKQGALYQRSAIEHWLASRIRKR